MYFFYKARKKYSHFRRTIKNTQKHKAEKVRLMSVAEELELTRTSERKEEEERQELYDIERATLYSNINLHRPSRDRLDDIERKSRRLNIGFGRGPARFEANIAEVRDNLDNLDTRDRTQACCCGFLLCSLASLFFCALFAFLIVTFSA